MKHQYEDYIEFCDKEIAKRKRVFEGLVRPIPDQLNRYHDVGIASLLANKATLERHKEQLVPAQLFPEHQASIVCSSCESWQFGKLSVPFPCPSLLDVTTQLDEVMG